MQRAFHDHVPVPTKDNMLAQQAAPTAARGGGKAAKGGKGGGKARQGWWPCGAPDPLCAAALNARYSVRAGGATAAELRPPATSHGVERRRDGPESRRKVCHDRGREARGDGCARPALRRRLNARYSIRDGGAPRRQSCGRRRPSPRPRRRPVDKHARTAIEKEEKEGGTSGARGRGVGGRGRGRARGNPTSGGDNASGGSAGGARRACRRSPARS